jgi:hypothetical protein
VNPPPSLNPDLVQILSLNHSIPTKLCSAGLEVTQEYACPIEEEKLVQVKETEYTITMLSRTEIHNHYINYNVRRKRENPHATTDYYNCC